MCQTSCGYYPSLVWEAQAARYTNVQWKEREKAGFDDLMAQLHERAGLVWPGMAVFGHSFHLFANKEIKKVADFKGLKIRTFPPFMPFVKALGAAPINLPMSDIYTGMERGAIDGFAMTHYGFVKDFSWHEVTKYVLDYDLYQGGSLILANPKKWGQIPSNVRTQMAEYKKAEINSKIEDLYLKENATQRHL